MVNHHQGKSHIIRCKKKICIILKIRTDRRVLLLLLGLYQTEFLKRLSLEVIPTVVANSPIEARLTWLQASSTTFLFCLKTSCRNRYMKWWFQNDRWCWNDFRRRDGHSRSIARTQVFFTVAPRVPMDGQADVSFLHRLYNSSLVHEWRRNRVWPWPCNWSQACRSQWSMNWHQPSLGAYAWPANSCN